MDNRYEIMIAFRENDWNKEIAGEYDKKACGATMREDMCKRYASPNEIEYIIFYWGQYRDWTRDKMSLAINELASIYPCDYIVVKDGTTVEKEYYELGVLNLQSIRPLFPGELFWEDAVKENERLKKYLIDKYHLTLEQIEDIVGNNNSD